MNCPKCGAATRSDSLYCQSCGSPVLPEEVLETVRVHRAARSLGRRRKVWWAKVLEGTLKLALNMLLEIVRFLPRMLRMIFEGIARI